MSSALDLVEILAELFSWIGLILAALCFFVLLVLRSTRGGWDETEAVIITVDGQPQLRWMAIDGTLHSRELHPDEAASLADPEQLHVHYNRRSPHRVRFDVVGHGEKVLRALAFIFLGIGATSLIVSLVALFLPH